MCTLWQNRWSWIRQRTKAARCTLRPRSRPTRRAASSHACFTTNTSSIISSKRNFIVLPRSTQCLEYKTSDSAGIDVSDVWLCGHRRVRRLTLRASPSTFSDTTTWLAKVHVRVSCLSWLFFVSRLTAHCVTCDTLLRNSVMPLTWPRVNNI